jgi:hypothetical protein
VGVRGKGRAGTAKTLPRHSILNARPTFLSRPHSPALLSRFLFPRCKNFIWELATHCVLFFFQCLFGRGLVRYRINRQYRLKRIYLVEVKKSIYAIRAKKINKMKKSKHKIQWANLACWISRFASFDCCAGKRKNRCNEQNISRA